MSLGVEVPGGKIKNKNFEFEAFRGPSGQNQLFHTLLLFKILDLTKNKKIVNNPFKFMMIVIRSCHYNTGFVLTVISALVGAPPPATQLFPIGSENLSNPPLFFYCI